MNATRALSMTLALLITCAAAPARAADAPGHFHPKG